MKQKIQYLLGLFNPKLLTRVLYFKTFHSHLNLKNPRTINEKIHWMKFYGDTSQWSYLADKYRVRKYVEDKGLSGILVKIYDHWDDVNDVNWEELPSQFVMKINNGCGDVLICKDKNKLDKEAVIKEYRRLMTKKFGVTTGQLHYKDISPCIIAEELLDNDKQQIKSFSLIDYKIWCFNGSPEYVFVCANRTKSRAEIMLYDKQWVSHPEYIRETNHFVLLNNSLPKPICFDKMLEIASVLSDHNPEMRVDLYLVDGRIYFGELTLTSACGFMNYFTDSFLLEMGNRIQLPIE